MSPPKRDGSPSRGPRRSAADRADTLAARHAALRILCESEARRIPADRVRSPLLERARLDSRSRRFATTLVQGAFRWRGRADRVLDARLAQGFASLDLCTRNILRLAYVQLFHLERVPAYAAVDTAVALARKLQGSGKARLVNGVLRGLTRNPPREEEWSRGKGAHALEGEWSHPAWLLERWIARWGMEETRRICAWNNAPPDFHLRVTGGPAEVAHVSAALLAAGIDAGPGAILPEALRVAGSFDVSRDPLLASGGVTIQDESQMLAGRLWPDPEAGPVADVCAAPGTKASHLASLAREVPVFAGDAGVERARLVAKTAARLGLANLHAYVADARRPPLRPAAIARLLLDAPCTSLGVLRRRPDARWLRGPDTIAAAARLQEELLASAALLVRPGGWLLYIVCTLEPEETDRQTERFRETQRGFGAEEWPGWVPGEIRAGPGIIRILPGVLGMEGLYAALWRRESG